MLQVTETAATALQQARAAQDLPETFGVRIYGQPTAQGQIELGLGFSEAPDDGDEVVEEVGTQIFIAPEVVVPLADSVLDVHEAPEGPRLVIRPQDDAEA